MVQALAALILFQQDFHLQIPDEKAPAAQSLQALWKDRLRVTTADLSLHLPGGIEIFDLEGFARRCGGTVHDMTIENANRLPIDPYDITAIEAAGIEYGEYLSKKTPPGEKTLAIRAGLKAEVTEPTPSIRNVADDPALRGFSVGDVLPWCGHAKGVYRQRTLGGTDAKALAVSTSNGEAVIVRKGNIYGVDLLIDEPNEKWDNRGAFHKWVPVSNLAGLGVRAGRYWPKKPTYAEFAAEVRKFAESHREWSLEVIGRRGADDIHSLTLGDPAKPLYVFIGMPHAEDEWVPALGSLSFAVLLSRSRDLPEVKARLEKFSVKIYPLLHPSIYESPLVEPGEAREPDRIDLEKTRRDNAYSITQLHQGGDVLVPACGTPLVLAKRIAGRARDDFSGRHVWWYYHHQQYGPQVWEATAPVSEMPPSWSAYWWQDGKTSCYQLYPHDVVFAAKAMYFIEQDFIQLMPERFMQAQHHHALHRMLFEHSSIASLLLTDETANWCLSIFLTDHDGQERDANWRPEKKR